MAIEFQPYVGPRPFEQGEETLFFGRDREASELLSLVIAHPVVLLYATSGAGKTSLLNAGLIPLLEEERFEVLPPARVQGLVPEDIESEEIPNLYVFNTLMSWAEDKSAIRQLAQMSIANFLKQRERPIDEEGLPSPRVVIFDQFEELLTFYPERWRDREGFFEQIHDTLEGSPLLFRVTDLKDSASLVAKLRNKRNPLSQYLREQFPPNMQRLLDEYGSSTSKSEALSKTLVDELNRLVQSKSLYDKHRFAQVTLTEETQRLIEQNPQGNDLIRLNRLLLEEAYPHELTKSLEGDPLLRVVFVIREDCIAQLDPYASLLPEKLRIRFRLERLRKRAALAAVTGPLRDTRRSFAEDVAEQLVEELLKVRIQTAKGETEVITGEFIEPVQLQVVCQSLWRDLPPDATVITQDHLQAFGDVNQALSEFYERCIERAAQEADVKERDLREWFEHTLITPAGTRGTVYRGREETSGIPNAAVDVLENRHLMRGEWRAGARWYELTHDRFIGPIQRSNEAWRAARRERWLRIGAGVAVVLVLLFVGITALQAIISEQEVAETQATATVAAQETGTAMAHAEATATVRAQKEAEALSFLSDADQSISQSDYDQAIVDCTRAIEFVPDFAEAYYKRGFIYAHYLKEYEKAIADYDRAIELDPEHKWAYTNKGSALRELGRYDEALAALDQAIQLDPEFAWAYNERGRVYSDREQYERAIEEYDKAIELDPEHKWAYTNKGYALRELDHYDEALAALDQAIQLDPEFTWAYNERGRVYSDREQYEQAIEEYDKTIELDPEHKWAYTNKGSALRELGRYDEALAALDQAIQLDPEYVWAYDERGNVYSDREQYERAIAEYDKAIELDPEHKWVYANKGHALRKLGRYDEALAALDQAIQLDPEFTWAYYERGNVYSDREQYERAIAEYDKAIELDPEDKWAYVDKGYTLRELGRYDEALAAFDQVIKLDPEYAWAYYERGRIYSEREEYERAIEEYDKFIELDPEYADAYFDRGLAYKQLGEKEKAIADFRAFLKLSKDEYWRSQAEQHLKELGGQ